MQRILLGVLIAGVALSGTCVSVHGEEQGMACPAPGGGAPPYPVVRVVVYQDVIKHVCRMVPDVKKKWVYSWVDDPFCIRDKHKGGCPGCAGPHCRKLLLKRLVEEPCGEKCIVETIVEKVPVVVCRPSPCDAVPMPVVIPPGVILPLPRPIPQMPPANGETPPKVPQMPPANGETPTKPPRMPPANGPVTPQMPPAGTQVRPPAATPLPEPVDAIVPPPIQILPEPTLPSASETLTVPAEPPAPVLALPPPPVPPDPPVLPTPDVLPE